MVAWNLNSIRCPGVFLYGTSELAKIVGAIRPDLADRSQDGGAPTLDEFLGLVQAWLAAHPQHYLDADGCVEDLGGHLSADAFPSGIIGW
jgi:hypothetical protein